MLPSDPALKEELLAIDAWYDDTGKLQLKSKRDVNAKLGGDGRSTDTADSAALSVALEFALVEDDGWSARMRERRQRYEEDPYSTDGSYDLFDVAR